MVFAIRKEPALMDRLLKIDECDGYLDSFSSRSFFAARYSSTVERSMQHASSTECPPLISAIILFTNVFADALSDASCFSLEINFGYPQ